MVRVVKKCASLPRIKLVKKVAAYCRVSTQQEMQYISLAAQRSYYEKMVADHPEWTLVGIYADINLITEFTSDQMRVLHLFNLRDYKEEIQFSNVSEYFDETWSKIDISYLFALVTELIRYGSWLLPCISSCFQGEQRTCC